MFFHDPGLGARRHGICQMFYTSERNEAIVVLTPPSYLLHPNSISCYIHVGYNHVVKLGSMCFLIYVFNCCFIVFS